MKRALQTVLLLVAVVSAGCCQNTDFYPEHWSQVYRYEIKGLPQSALGVVDSIYSRAKQDKILEEQVKALTYQSKFAVSTREDAELIVIRKFEREIQNSEPPLKNILESLLGNLYWQYFKENRWKYYQRSQTAETVNTDDFRTWDANAMFKTIHHHFSRSLENKPMLRNVALESIDEILVQAENSKKYRPTLYDFLMHNAIDFYSTGESMITKPSNGFKIIGEEYFVDFENVNLQSGDSFSPLLQALLLYRDLLSFHRVRADTTAYVNLELERLSLVADQGDFDTHAASLKNAWNTLREKYRNHPASALVMFEVASFFHKAGMRYGHNKEVGNQFKLAEALTLCNEAISRFPDSDGARKCEGLKTLILNKRLSLVAEKNIPINTPSLVLIRYTNVDRLHFAVYPIPESLKERVNDGIDDQAAETVMRMSPPRRQWNVKLKDIHDYQSHTTEAVLDSLPGGGYLVTATAMDDDVDRDTIFAYATIQVTNLGLLEYATMDEHHYRVVDRRNGAPIAGAEVHLQTVYDSDNTRPVNERLTTGKDGEVSMRRHPQYTRFLSATVRYQNDKATFGNYYTYAASERADKDATIQARTFLFTDRSIYRPGQTVFFKGILIKTKDGKSTVVPGQYVVVRLDDVNGSEVGSLRLKSNAFGSFSGEFKLPSTGLTGEYTLYADEDDEETSRFYDNLDDFTYSEHFISVEEYKRPTFEVTFKPVTETFTLNDTVRLTGVAEAYSGSHISGARVTYKVTRRVQYPRWYYWNFNRSYADAAEIAHGEIATDDQGGFTISFTAIPDEKTSPETNPVFVYEIKADIIDISGETRSATSNVKIGYHAVTATITAPEQIDLQKRDNAIGITSENLNGQFVPLKGKVQIFKLKAPDTPIRERPWEAPDLPLLSKQQFQKLFPHDAYAEPTNPKAWENQKLMLELPFDTRQSPELKYRTDTTWPLGHYRIELTALDSAGRTVKDFYYFSVTDSRSNAVPDNALVIFQLDKPSYKVGEVARLTVGSASPNATFFVHIERDHDIVKTYVEHFNANTKTILIPIREEKEQGFSISCSGALYNAFVYKTISIPVISTAEEIQIETLTFKDKLQAGAKETWSFSIKGPDSAPREAEVLASMYDASLDQFKPHQWSFQPKERSYYFGRVFINGGQSFGETYFQVRNLEFQRPLPAGQYYDRFDWFGFSFTKDSYVQRAYLERLYSSGAAADKPSRIRISNEKHLKAGYVYGRIVDSDGAALPGVNVVIKGTTIGTVTDADGNYAIEADRNDVLVYSFIGYATAKARVGRKNTIDVIMEPDVIELSEVVVTGYGVQTKRAALASVVSMVQIDSVASEIVFEEAVGEVALEGATAGVQIAQQGKFYSMSIRGTELSAPGARPLFVVDGVIVDASRIDQEDLSNVQVLKGSAAVAIYGAQAANGVIIVTTKSGQKKLDEELARVSTRKNFNETAFFYPHLSTNEDGKVRFSFTSPESLTRWKLQLLAHTKDLQTTTKTLQAITQKELMVTPNVPRFLRIGDKVSFTVKIANLSDRTLNGKVGLQLTDAITGKNVDGLFGNGVRNKDFKIYARKNTDVSWTLSVPEGVGALQYRVVAKAGNFSDGEQNALPILSNRTLVTETMPLYVRSSQTKTFTLDKLQHAESSTLKHHRLTLEATSNPAWYAVQSLPYLMEFPHECAEQLFSRYYANAVAAHIVETNPVIRDVFEKWSSQGDLVSNLEKNAELKFMMIAETPWLRDAQSESEQKKRLSLLFDLSTMKNQMTSVLEKIGAMQFSDGGFPWFAGSDAPNRFITQHIVATYGHLKRLKVADYAGEKAMIRRARSYLDREFVEEYEALLKEAEQAALRSDGDKGRAKAEYLAKRHVSQQAVHYLYARSFFSDSTTDARLRSAIDYYSKQTATFWLDFNLYSKGMIALAQYRSGNTSLAQDIMRSLKENAIRSDELGMYWKDNTGGMYWYQAPIETQALMIEAFAEILRDEDGADTQSRKTIDDLRLWLLKNKQTNRWETTKATTEAVYALLVNGTNWLSLDGEVGIKVGAISVAPDSRDDVEVATGYFKTSWQAEAITPDMATVTLSKKGEGVAWGGLYWQYFEDLDKITAAETPLKLARKLFVVTNADQGELLKEISSVDVKPGDRVRVRIELTADRPMEFLHMKDMRAAGFEPVDVLSGYKWQEGLGYYQSTRDASTNFFFELVPRGIYVFEYDLRVNNKGNFSNGITTIQSMYAPEFTSHSEGQRVEVR